jgi:enoyl-CoA hydratase / 3-hydroxyacyl-CoA dehydrogenase
MKVGVIGSGSIGPDLAYGFLSAIAREPDAKVYLVDIKQEALDAGVARIQGYVKKGLSRGKLSPKVAKAIDAALTPTLELGDLKDCSYVLEAASEDLPVKKAILKNLEAVVGADCLIGFATSGIPRAQIAVDAKLPERCFVNHPFYPAWRSLPIEIVLSGDEALGQRMVSMMERLGKVPIITADVACFAADDVFCNYISEAARLVADGVANAAQVDKIVHDAIGGGGPLNVMDLTRGNMLVHKCQVLMQEAPTGSDWFTPPPILEERGSDAWRDRKAPADSSYDDALKAKVLDPILAVLFARTYFVADNDICELTELNWLTRMALGFNKGVLELAEDYGVEGVHALCAAYAETHPGFEIPESIAKKKLPTFRKFTRVTRDGGIGTIEIFRPEVKNALNSATIAEIESAIDELGMEEAIKGIVFTSSDGALAGADIMELASLESAEACRGICLKTHPIMEKIEALDKPVVAALDGPVLGGGAEFSMACHARVAGKGLLVGQPEVNLGIIPGYGGSQRLPRLVGIELATEMLRGARNIGAAQACKAGWAHGEPVADPITKARSLIGDHLEGKVTLGPVDPAPMKGVTVPSVDIAHRSLAIDAILVDVMKRGLSKPLSEGLRIEADGFGRCFETVDMDIGMKNFIQNGPRVPATFLHE